MAILTPLQKEQKKTRDNLRIVHNRLLSAFSFKQIHTWIDASKFLGNIPPDYIAKPISFSLLNDLCKHQASELEQSFQSNGKADKADIIIDALNKGYDKETTAVHESKLIELVQEVVDSSYNESNDYGLSHSPNENPSLHLYWFQKLAVTKALRKIHEGRRGILILAATGTGKTFIAAAINRRLMDNNFAEDKTFAAVPYVYCTKATIIGQTNRVFKNLFNIEPNVDTEIINIEMLRSKGGQLWLKKEVYIEQGEEKERWIWKKGRQPVAFFLDESQGAKNKGSTQSQIIYAYNDIPDDTVLICISATPFTRVSEAKAFAVSTRRPLDHIGFPKGTYLCNENWNAYAAAIASPSAPDEYNQAAVDRLMKDLEDYVVRVRGVKPQFEAKNGVQFVQFESDEKRKFYNDAWERFLKRKAKLDALKDADEEVSNICYLLELQQFSKAAEFCHAEGFADKAYQCYLNGKAPVIAVKFKDTLIEITRIWIEKYGISRDNITLVWGGGQTQQTEKQKQKEKILKKMDKLVKLGIDPKEFLDDLGLGDVEDRKIVEYPAHYRLGAQSLEDRQREIDRFQSGKSNFAIYTLKAGGVGLSLHHTDDFTTDWNRNAPGFDEWFTKISKLKEDGKYEHQQPKPGKVRRKKSGFAVEEDIPFIPVRQRETFVVVTYNAIELVQGIGRVPRLTSLTITIQNVYCYAGTVEVQMGHVYSQKLRCLTVIVRQREDWQDVILSGGKVELVDAHINTTKDAPDDESTMVDDEAGEEDE